MSYAHLDMMDDMIKETLATLLELDLIEKGEVKEKK